eukprot:601856-Rhodomonas_salina.1
MATIAVPRAAVLFLLHSLHAQPLVWRGEKARQIKERERERKREREREMKRHTARRCQGRWHSLDPGLVSWIARLMMALMRVGLQ